MWRRFKRWRLRRLRRRLIFLEAKFELYERFPHHLGFDGLARVAREQRRIDRVRYHVGLLELELEFLDPPRARAIETVRSA